MKKIILALFLFSLFLPILALARIGVGVGTGKIEIDQPMKAGLIYDLPPLVVLNTGDEPSDYGVTTQRRENQPELIPEQSWFSFEPVEFFLEPGKTQLVNIRLTLPVKGAKPGDYFTFLQAFPVKKTEVVGTSIGVAAASKLYFTVAPSNIFVGFYYRLTSLISLYSPWSHIIIFVFLAAVFGILAKRFIKLNFKVSITKK
ncbi:MAG: hypothetical protein PHO91_04275 [Patescibacteria group bacterium]|nr:hypothetical protein [Patescibacteria group bacterium]